MSDSKINADTLMGFAGSFAKGLAGSLVLLSFALALSISFIAPHVSMLTEDYFHFLELELEMEKERALFNQHQHICPSDETDLTDILLRLDGLEEVAHPPAKKKIAYYPLLINQRS